MKNSQSDTIIFLHIPKTGGRSLQNILLRHFGREASITDGHEKIADIKTWNDDRKRKIRYVQGHFIYGMHNNFPQNANYITVLRDPIERVISHYYYIRRSPEHPLNKVISENNIDLHEYVTSGVCEEVNNDQTRMISGFSRDAPISSEEMLNTAMNNIENKFLLAGIVEQFDETLILLKKQLGLRNIFYGVRNQTFNRPTKNQIQKHTLEAIQAHNALDVELYEHAQQLLSKKISSQGPTFSQELARFKLLNKPYSRLFYIIRKIKNNAFIAKG